SPTTSLPAEIIVPPVYVFVPVRNVIPVPRCSKTPVPEMLASLAATQKQRSTERTPLFTTLPVMLPVLPPLPNCRVPDEINVPPLYVFCPVSIVVPLPICCSDPVPEMTPPTVTLSERLIASTELSTMFPSSDPPNPPLPRLNVPPLIVVVPENVLVPVSVSVP